MEEVKTGQETGLENEEGLKTGEDQEQVEEQALFEVEYEDGKKENVTAERFQQLRDAEDELKRAKEELRSLKKEHGKTTNELGDLRKLQQRVDQLEKTKTGLEDEFEETPRQQQVDPNAIFGLVQVSQMISSDPVLSKMNFQKAVRFVQDAVDYGTDAGLDDPREAITSYRQYLSGGAVNTQQQTQRKTSAEKQIIKSLKNPGTMPSGGGGNVESETNLDKFLSKDAKEGSKFLQSLPEAERLAVVKQVSEAFPRAFDISTGQWEEKVG